jgi:hypothetical protein
MQSIRVEAPSARSASALEQKLRALGMAEAEPLGGDVWEVRMRSSTLVGEILSTVEGWLRESGVPATVVRIDERPYTLLAPASLAG